MKKVYLALLIALFAFCLVFGAAAQSGSSSGSGEKTVEESYLQESLETMIIREQSQAESKDMKLVALQYIGQAIAEGRKNDEIQRTLEFLVLESLTSIARDGGLGRPKFNYPDVRAKACDYLGDFPNPRAQETLIKVIFVESEPMVLSAAVRALGKIGANTGDEAGQAIAFIINRFDILSPDNSLAFEALVAFERIAEKNGGIKDPSVIRAIMRIAEGNYITPVKNKARDLLAVLRKYSSSAATPPTSGSGK